jgi:hypothetical protein
MVPKKNPIPHRVELYKPLSIVVERLTSSAHSESDEAIDDTYKVVPDAWRMRKDLEVTLPTLRVILFAGSYAPSILLVRRSLSWGRPETGES